jgi:8-oxo-dGTP pyrophosphatase MutT (NUDIX family)
LIRDERLRVEPGVATQLAEGGMRDASTVVLLRDGPRGVEAWLLTRVAHLAFAAGMSVFPGGRVEPGDADLPWAGAPPADPQLVGAAVRETFEETGVLLGVPGLDLRADRADVEAGRTQFGALLRSHGVAIDASGLRPWARWITPEAEIRRYDTRFFVAGLPPGTDPAAVTGEAVHAGWVLVGDALAQQDRGERRMLPPTIVTLRSITPFPSVADVLAAAAGRSLEPVRASVENGQVVLPGGERFTL